MFAQELNEFRASMLRQGIMFAYSGYITEPVLSGVGEALKQKLSEEEADTKTLRSVFAIYVEQMQNVIRYSAEKTSSHAETPAALRFGVLTIGHIDDTYVIHVGNVVNREDVERMRKRLNEISAMDRAQLKKAYKEQLKAGPDEHSKGAGLGFIEIARRASKPIEFNFSDLDEEHAFFALKASI